jgi:hypothetical protein
MARAQRGFDRDLTGIKIPYWDKIHHLSLQIPEDPSRDFKVLSLTDFSLGLISQQSCLIYTRKPKMSTDFGLIGDILTYPLNQCTISMTI